MEQKEQKLAKKRGRKPINIDLVELERLSGMGLSERQIASALDISNSTLTRKKHIKQIEHALKKGRAKAVALVSSKLFDNAMEGKETSAIFFLKNRDPENWKDRQEVINASINLNDVINGAKTRLGGHMTNIIDAKEIKPLHTSDAEGEQLVSKKLQQKKTKG